MELNLQSQNNNKYIIVEADRNLGGCILLRDTYIRRGVIKHLGNTQVYKPLSQQQGNNHQRIIARKISLFVSKWSNQGEDHDLLSKTGQHVLLESIRKYLDNMAKFKPVENAPHCVLCRNNDK